VSGRGSAGGREAGRLGGWEAGRHGAIVLAKYI
jgi:hypothetical protein